MFGWFRAEAAWDFALEAGQGLTVLGEIIGEEFERDESVEASVLGLINDAHAAPAEFFNDAVVRNSLSHEGRGVRHFGDILGWGQRQVNEESQNA